MTEKKNNTGMFLESPSGYMMPFESEQDVQVTLYYGEQTHPKHGGKFHHNGWDFVATHLPLYALATGAVVGVGNDAIHDNYIITRYGKFDVKYGHVAEVFCNYGMQVEAGMPIATSGDFLHFEVKYDGKYIDPADFIGMLFANVTQLEAMGIQKYPQFANMGSSVRTDYDKDQNEIVEMMLRYLPFYMNDINQGIYQSPQRMQSSLRNIFQQSADKNYFFEQMPNIGNPLGLSGRAAPLVGKVQNLLIGDFLNYMAVRHDTYLSSWSEGQKKNFRTKQQKMDIL